MPRKTAGSDPPTPFRMRGKPVAGRTSNLGFQPVQKTPIIRASSGGIWGIPGQMFRHQREGSAHPVTESEGRLSRYHRRMFPNHTSRSV